MTQHFKNIIPFLILFIFISQDLQTFSQQQTQSNVPHSINQQTHHYQMQKSYDDNQAMYEQLNSQIQSLSNNFIFNYLHAYHQTKNTFIQAFSQTSFDQEKLNRQQINKNPGNFLLLLAKMYLYDVLPKSLISGEIWSSYQTQSSYILAYYYLKIAAEKYQNKQAYYYLGILQYHKITPDLILQKNLQSEILKIELQQGTKIGSSTKYENLINHLKSSHLVNTENNLYIASLLQHNGASLILANLNRNGIGMDKNCSTAISYYMSIIKNTYVDNYEFRSLFSDEESFQKQLFAKKRTDFKHYGEQDISVIWDTLYYDQQTIKTTYQIAQHYYIGRAGFIKNYTQAAILYQKLAAQNHKLSMTMLAMCYLKGQGVPADRKRARLLFNQAKNVELAQSMLLTMDYFQIQRVNTRKSAILKLKQKYQKKRQTLNPTLKYLMGSLIVGGEITGINKDQGLVLLQEAAASGHLMAKITMGLIFLDGIDVSFDCVRASKYFSEEGLAHPFFIDKLHLAKVGINKQKYKFALLKYLQLSVVGESTSFVNGLYMLQIYPESYQLNQNSWSVSHAKQNLIYKKLRQYQIVPDIQVYFLKRYNLVGHKTFTLNSLSKFLTSNQQINQDYKAYARKKIIRVGAVTKQNSLIKFYQYKMKKQPDVNQLSQIANDKSDKLHVMESRYLLGKIYHQRSYQKMIKGEDYSKQQYKALQQYKRSTKSQILGKIIFYVQQYKLGSVHTDHSNSQMFQFGIKDDLLTYTLFLSIMIFFLYYRRSKKLDQIHQTELKKHNQQARIRKQQEQFRTNQQKIEQEEQSLKIRLGQRQKIYQILKNDINQPTIIEQDIQAPKGYRIGSSAEEE